MEHGEKRQPRHLQTTKKETRAAGASRGKPARHAGKSAEKPRPASPRRESPGTDRRAEAGPRPAAQAAAKPAPSPAEPAPDRGARPIKNPRGRRSYFAPVYFVVLFVYLESVFHAAVFQGAPALYPLLFAVPAGLLFGTVCGLFRERAGRVLRYVITAAVALLFGVQVVYHHSFFSFMSLGQVGMGGAVFANFFKSILLAVWECMPVLLLLLLPLALLPVAHKILRPDNRPNWKRTLCRFAAFCAAQAAAILLLPLSGAGSAHSAYQIYHADDLMLDLSVEKLGLLTTTRKDLTYLLAGGSATVEIPLPSLAAATAAPDGEDAAGGEDGTAPEASPGQEQGVDPVYNIIPGLDFAQLAAEQSDENVRQTFSYLAQVQPTKKNEYTGMFKDYNLILICAEAFSTAAVDEQLTPTLYRLANSGFVFQNYYTMFSSNTTNGEYALLTGLIPDINKPKTDSSFLASADNTMDQNIGTFFNAMGVTTRAYHDHTANYYDRNITHPNLGYVFKGREEIGGLSGWPESDLTMMERTLPEYINDDIFHAYYMTVSGHHNYRFDGYNDIADKNADLVADLDLCTSAKAYLACSIELDRALEYLIDELDKAGKLDRTVICLSTDHYPYGLLDDEYRQLHDSGARYDGLDRYQSTLILWNSAMDTVQVSKPCCTVDVLPTLLNLFGFQFDSRLYAGRDILSDSEGMAIIYNESFITDELAYNSRYESKFPLVNGWSEPPGYVTEHILTLQERFSLSSAILNYDLYAKLHT